jgi:hypothetical protein
LSVDLNRFDARRERSDLRCLRDTRDRWRLGTLDDSGRRFSALRESRWRIDALRERWRRLGARYESGWRFRALCERRRCLAALYESRWQFRALRDRWRLFGTRDSRRRRNRLRKCRRSFLASNNGSLGCYDRRL